MCETSAKRLVTLNLTADDETGALSAADLLDALTQHAPQFRADVVLADPAVAFRRQELEDAAARLGATLVVSSVAHPGRPGVHDPLRLAAAYRDVLR